MIVTIAIVATAIVATAIVAIVAIVVIVAIIWKPSLRHLGLKLSLRYILILLSEL